MVEAEIPLYLNWSFWAVVIAAIAVFLSQIPPIKELIKKAKLDLEVYSKISITHKIGNPNLQLHIILSNIGGRNVRVKDITVSISRDGNNLSTLPAQNYLQNQNDQSTLLFTTFSLKPNQEWAHIINFLNFFNREDEKEYQSIEGAMLTNYREIVKELDADADKNHMIEHPQNLIKKAFDFYNSKQIWKSGEYLIKVNIVTSNHIADISKLYRFTLFESHEEQLQSITEHYKFGGGIWWNPERLQTNVILQIAEA